MLYYLGSHRWLWGWGGWGSQRANALPPVAAVMLFTAAAHAVHTVHTPANTCTFLATSVISSISHTYRPLAITIHPPAGLPTGICDLVEWVTSLMGRPGPNARARAYTTGGHSACGTRTPISVPSHVLGRPLAVDHRSTGGVR